MEQQATRFGSELRRLRMSAGLSLAGLAGLVHYSRGHLSKIETGHKVPPRDLARLCDTVFDAGGALAALVPAKRTAPYPEPVDDDRVDVWVTSVADDGTTWFRMMDRRQALAAVAMVTGWCLYDLGRPKEAAEILDEEVARLPMTALRSRARYGVRRALAHVGAGEIEHACAPVDPLLETVDVVGSATVLTDVRRLARALSRFHANGSVRALSPKLTAALHEPVL